jgi:hypothetical protein
MHPSFINKTLMCYQLQREKRVGYTGERPAECEHLQDWNEFNSLQLYVPGKLPTPRCVRARDGWTPKKIHMDPQTLYPNKEMMEDFEKFVAFAWWLGAGFPGICRVIPYEGYTPNSSNYENANEKVKFDGPLSQRVKGKKDKGDLFVLEFDAVKKANLHDLQGFYDYTINTCVNTRMKI